MIKSSAGKVTQKYLNSSIFANVSPAGTGNLVTPALPANGVSNGQREGDSLAIDAIEVRFLAYNDQAAVGVNDTDLIRLICVQARASNAVTISNSAAPTTGVLDLGPSGIIEQCSFINFNAKNELFHVLLDKCFPVNCLSSKASNFFDFTLHPKVEKINFTPGTTTAMCGQIYWIAQSLQAACDISVEQRLVYHDL
jgi:hypothetical protein